MVVSISYLPRAIDEPFTLEDRVAHVGRLRIPLRLALRIVDAEVALQFAFRRRFRPHLLWPEELTGYDGEPPYYLRADLAADRGEVCDYWIKQWGWASFVGGLEDMDSPMDIRLVSMLESPEEQGPEYDDTDGAWVECPKDTPASFRYWKWDGVA